MNIIWLSYLHKLSILEEEIWYKGCIQQYVLDVVLSCLNECIECIENELNDSSVERDEIFNYYYKTSHILSDIILSGKDEYVPHMTVGKLPSIDLLDEVFEDVVKYRDKFSTVVKKISVETIGENEESIIIIEQEIS